MRQRSADEKYTQMTETPVEPLICKMAIPTIISMLITTIYNMADTFFIGKMDSTSASGAVGIAFSVMAVIQAVGFFFGQGAGNTASRALGNHDNAFAEQLAATSFFSAIGAGLLIAVFGLLFLEPLTLLLGATPTIQPYAMSYVRIILLGAPYMAAALVLNNLLRFQGNAIYGMIGLIGGGILNIILDPILIFGFNMGISGAAYATIISQAVSFLILLYQCNHAGIVKIHIKNFLFSWRIYGPICNGGLPSMLRQSIASVATICLNTAAKPFGDAAIAAMAIVSRITVFSNSTIIGFGQGFQPVCGYNYGAGLYQRVLKGFWFCVKLCTGALILIAAAEYILAPQFVALFQKSDPEVIRIGAQALRYQCLSLPTLAWIIMSNMLMQTLGKVVAASAVSIARQGLFLIPTVLVLPRVLGLPGILTAQPVADYVTFAMTIPIQLVILRRLKRASTDILPYNA